MINYIFLISFILLIFILISYQYKNEILNKEKIKKDNDNTKYRKFFEDKKIYTNIYELAPYQATSLSPINKIKMKSIIKQMNSYPNNIRTNPNWKCPWYNGYNNMYCFIDKHLNRKCIWTC